MGKKVTLSSIKRQTNTSNLYYVTWKFKASHVDHYKVVWSYQATKKDNAVWFIGSDSTTEAKQSTYNPPDNAYRIKVSVTPVAKTHQVKRKDKQNKEHTKTEAYWGGTAVTSAAAPVKINYIFDAAPAVPTVSIALNKAKNTLYLTAIVEHYDDEKETSGDIDPTDIIVPTGAIEFEIVSFNAATTVSSDKQVTVLTRTSVDKKTNKKVSAPYKATLIKNRASIKITAGIQSGYAYRVRARRLSAAFTDTSKSKSVKRPAEWMKSQWSEYSSDEVGGTNPAKTTGLKVVAYETSPNHVKLTWNNQNNVKEYEIQYTDNNAYFENNSSEVSSDSTGTNIAQRIIGNIETGKNYYFRVRAVNDVGEGEWSSIVRILLKNVKPDPPTTWSNVLTVAINSDGKGALDGVLYWTHNDPNEALQNEAVIGIAIERNGKTGKETYITIKGAASYYSLTETNRKLKNYGESRVSDAMYEGAIIHWRVKTKSFRSADYSDYSATRTIKVYKKPTLGIGLYTMGSWLWDPFNFETDNILYAQSSGGNLTKTLTKYPLIIKLVANPKTQKAVSFHISINSNSTYTVTDELGESRTVHRGDSLFSETYTANSTNPNVLSVNLKPGDVDLDNGRSYTINASVGMNSGLEAEAAYAFDVKWADEEYSPNAEVIVDENTYSTSIRPFIEEGNTNVYFSIYRREYDGSFTLIAGDIPGDDTAFYKDPHPSLNYARYRIVATSLKTGSFSFYDMPGIPMMDNEIVIQWEENWSEFNYDIDETPEEPEWTGSLLVLPYNIDISVEHDPDVALVNYIGRQHPVSYYGTHRGESSKWSVEIDKSDVDTLYAIRRLASYMGDVYVREPSGIGYWAQVTVSYTENYGKPIIPVSFDIKRVEGGM